MDANNVFFTADLHLGHSNIIRYCDRPFKDIDEMNEYIIESWNSVVRESSSVYLLGDVAMRNNDRLGDLLDALHGQITLIKGNHDDGVINKHKRRFNAMKRMHEIRVVDPDAYQGRRKIILCHYPMITWNGSHHGTWHLHGHCHGTLPDDPHAFRLDVGVDCHDFMPVSYERVKELMSMKSFKPVDHHG